MTKIPNNSFKSLLSKLQKNGLVLLDHRLHTSKESIALNELVGSSEINWVDNEGSDHRVYGYQLLDDGLKKAIVQLSESIFKGYVQGEQMFAFVLAGILQQAKKNVGSGGGWHRDTVYGKQLKLIVYCSDVSEYNGPFQYINGSHRWYNKILISILLMKNPRSFRYSEKDIARLKKYGYKITECSAKAGTVILADTTGLHRGKPIVKGSRLALTVYTHHKPFRGDLGSYGSKIY